ncbi:MAG: hypothetical protein FJW39_03290 [Acidobacteria bacterium]|nr:hypothetical protein [Acidobacteriota bacterium]
MPWKRSLAHPIALFITFASHAFPQGSALGTISGRVTDQTESAIPEATVIATNTGTRSRYTASTTSDGFYRIPFVQPGMYTVEISRTGFQTSVQPKVQVTAASSITVNMRLTVGTIGQSISVTERVGLVEVENADRGGEIDRIRTTYTPTTARVVLSIVPSIPGVTTSTNDRGMTPSGNSGASAFMINGGVDRTSEMLLDGVPNRTSAGGYAYGIIPTQESVSEVKVITNAFSAEYGSTTGGVINIVTRSGGNDYHGEGFTYIRNTALNANHFERNLAGLGRTRLVYNTFGGIVTGRIRRDRLFGVLKYHTNRTNQLKSYTGRVPTQKERNGDFTETFWLNRGTPQQIVIHDPWTTQLGANGRFTRQPVPGNVIPASRINPVARNLWKYIPLPNVNTNTVIKAVNYIPSSQASAPRNYIEWMPKVDWNVSEKTKIMGRYITTTFDQTDQRFYESPADVNLSLFVRRNWNAALDVTHALSATSVLNLRAGLERYVQGGVEPNRLGAFPQELGFSPTFVGQAEPAFPSFTFGGSNLGGDRFTGAGQPAATVVPDQVNNFDVNWLKHAGRHTLKVGGQHRVERIYSPAGGYDAGLFSFGPSDTNGPDPQVQVAGAGDEVASFLFGVGSGRIERNSAPARQIPYYSTFVQDDIKVTSRLTVNLGLRWDFTDGLTDRFNAMTGPFDRNAASPLAARVRSAAGVQACAACANLVGGLTFPGVGGVSRSAYSLRRNDFGPRIAAAYALGTKTAIRSGYGYFYGPVYYDPGQIGFSQATPWVAYDANQIPLNTLANPFPTGVIPPVGASLGLATNIGAAVSFAEPLNASPRARQFSFEIQREVPWSMRVSAAYVNNIVSRLPVSRNLNSLTAQQYLLGPAALNARVPNPFSGLAPGFALNQATIAASSLMVPYPQFTSVVQQNAPAGRSRYDALQLYAVKRFSHGISFSTAFTWSKKLEATRYQWPTDAALEKTYSTFDIPWVFSPNFVFELPFGRGHWLLPNLSRWADAVIGGWQANAIIRIQGGKPIDLTENALPTGADPKGVPGGQSVNQWINPAAFRVVTEPFFIRRWSTRYSNVRAPGIRRFDLSATKRFHVSERMKFEFQAIATNAFNTPEFWDSPAGGQVNPASASFGRISGFRGISNAPRELQLGGRFVF